MTTSARIVRGMLLAGAASAMFAETAASQGESTGAGPAPQQPIYVSLKSDRVDLRQGPGNNYPTAWVFRRAGLPVQIIGEAENWRQVRDADGATGWVQQSMLSGRRTGLVRGPQGVELRTDNRESAGAVATIEAGVIASIRSCDGKWCDVAIGNYRGYIDQKRLWGLAPGEVVRELR